MVVPTRLRKSSKREALNIRIRPETRRLIDQAAGLAGKNRTDFILDAARTAAEERLLDRAVFVLKPAAFRTFLKSLDAPPNPSKRLLKSMQTPAPWD